MSKKILVSLSFIGIVAVIVIGATVAYFGDTETSAGNILVAGTLDLKVDHTKQTYNNIDCKTCSVTLISDPKNMVVAKNGTSVTPYPAVYVGSNYPNFIHWAWTAEEHDILSDAGAKWIWESDPTRVEDTTNNVIYTFRKTFEWWGPITGSDLWFAVGSDNSVEVWLNGVKIGGNPLEEFGYREESMLVIPGANITANVKQGTNVLEFRVKNFALAGSTPFTNPAGLIYKFSIDGLCEDDWFKKHCKLWGERDLGKDDTFWNFNDVKPGDRGVNVISLRAYDNDAFACLTANNIVDAENTAVSPEIKGGDIAASPVGELSQHIRFFAWRDDNDGVYEAGEQTIAGPNSSFAAAIGRIPLVKSVTKYIGIAWCAGTQTLVGNTISCDGSLMGNIAQTDRLTAHFTAYAEQQRNNAGFKCLSLINNGGFEMGNFTGWNVNHPFFAIVASTYTSGHGTVYSPRDGSRFAVLNAGAGAGVYTVISQTVTLKAGQKLAGWAAFDAKDSVHFNDDSAVVIVSGVPLATPWSKRVSDVGSGGESLWEYWSWTAPSDGLYTLELKVRNVGDNLFPSTALFDANVIE